MQPQLKRLEQLSPERRELMLKLLQQRQSTPTTSGAEPPPLQPVPREGALPLSFAQQRLWFLDQFEQGSAPYNMRVAARLTGHLDKEALRQSLAELVRRHEILRTVFPAEAGVPVQRIAPTGTFPLVARDLSGQPEAAQMAEVHRLAREEAQRPFDLAEGPLYRATLVRLGTQAHVLLFTMHHILADSWSLALLVREISVLYTAFAQGRPSPLPPLPIQYADFAVWQRQWLAGAVLEKQVDYWRQHLAGAPTLLGLPTDRPRPAVQRHHGATHPVAVSAPVMAALHALSRAEGATLFMTLLAAFKVLLFRYSGQTDLLVGTPIAGRNRWELESMIGFFANTLVLRTTVQGGERFRDLLARVRGVALAAYAHQDLAFERLVEVLQPPRSLSHTPLFQVMVTLQNAPAASLSLPGLTLELLDLEGETAKFDLELNVAEHDGALTGVIEYNTDLFERDTIARLARHFETLLASIAAAPNQAVAALPLLTPGEKHRLLVGWNNTATDYPGEQGVHRLFEAQAARSPDAAAVTDAATTWTYAELNRHANRIAHSLRAMGVGEGSTVALLAERGSALLAAILAIFKVGAAYVPLEPRYPVRRYRQVLTQSGAPFVLAADPFFPELEAATHNLPDRPTLVSLDSLLRQAAPDDNLPLDGGPHQLAYILYTSGSTGTPKGAMVESRGMINHLYAKINDLGLTAADVVAQNASQCFDISVWQFLAALLVGGRLCIYRDEVAYDPARLLERVVADGVTILEVVPSLMQAMLEAVTRDDAGDKPDLSALRWLIPTGEALPPALARAWQTHYPALPLLNAYGPTECSDDVTHHPIHEPPPPWVANMPIGRPVANTQIYLLDRCFQPVPIGVAGELYVGGDGVGRGYLHDPRRTALAFRPDPFSARPGARLYRTGDLGRYRADGTIEFLGRVDHQVKVRGFRIELGEIETVLRRYPTVQETVVLAREDAPGDKRLVAYVVADAPLSPPDVRAFLAEQLPDYMIPAAFVELSALPLTPNGKVDRKGLPAPDRDQLVLASRYVAPRTETEATLATIWQQALGIERVGVHDNFFEVGGHSLLGVQIAAQIQKQLQVEVPLRTLFTRPTIAELAASIETLKRTVETLTAPVDGPEDEREAFIL